MTQSHDLTQKLLVDLITTGMSITCLCMCEPILAHSRQGLPSKPQCLGGGPRVVVSTAAFHVSVRGAVPSLGGLKETKNVSSPSTCESQYCGELP